MSRFNFTQVRKPSLGGRFRYHPTPRSDAVRLTSKNIVIGGSLMRRYVRGRNTSATFIIEKDPAAAALRITQVPKTYNGDAHTYRLHMSNNRNDLHSVRMAGLWDMPNGNYIADRANTNVFVLQTQ